MPADPYFEINSHAPSVRSPTHSRLRPKIEGRQATPTTSPPPGGGTISFRAAPLCICMNPMPRVARDSKPVQKNSGRLTQGPSPESRPVPGGNVLVSWSDDGAHYV
jgi:hypothetical protein